MAESGDIAVALHGLLGNVHGPRNVDGEHKFEVDVELEVVDLCERGNRSRQYAQQQGLCRKPPHAHLRTPVATLGNRS